MYNIPQRIFLSFDPELNQTDNFNKLDTEFVLWGSKREDETDIEYVHLGSLKSNPSEFGMVKKEDYDRVVKGLKDAGAASLKLYSEAKAQADQLAKALRSCQRAIYGRSELSPDELLAMHNQSQTALTNYESLNKVK